MVNAPARPLTSVVASLPTRSRCRVLSWETELRANPICPAELEQRCVYVRCIQGAPNDTLNLARWLMPWLKVWSEHFKWTPTWQCVVGGSVEAYGQGELPSYLDFHSDMSRYLHPPAIGLIRCLRPDPGSSDGGANLFIRGDDILERLKQLGNLDLIELLTRRRPLHCNKGTGRTAALLPRATDEPVRIFDHRFATHGLHLELTPWELECYSEFLALLRNFTDLQIRLRLDAGECVVFSNRRWLHARSSCAAAGRTTEILLGNPPCPSTRQVESNDDTSRQAHS
jgi:hypothetical protein